MLPKQITISAPLFLLLTFAAVVAHANALGPVSQYLGFDWQQCTVIEEDIAANTEVRRCAKEGAPDIYIAEVFRHSFVGYGPEGMKQKAFNQSLLAFNSIFNTVELRTRDGQAPYAAIARYFTENESHSIKGQILVITKLQGAVACHMAYIDAVANPDASALAQQTADSMAPGFDCDRDEPKIVGESGKSPL